MKVLLYGENYWYGLAPPLKTAFETLGHQVDLFDWTQYLFRARGVNLVNKTLDRLLKCHVSRTINEKFQDMIVNNVYDCIIVITGWYINAETISIAKKHANCVVNWSMEELFSCAFSRLVETETYLKYDIVFSPRRNLFESYLSKGIQRVEYLPFFYYKEHRPVEIAKEEQGLWGSDIAFMGTWSKTREGLLKNLEDFNIKIWGGYWDRSVKDFKEKCTITNKIAWLGEMSKVANSTKIIVDVLTKAQSDKINMKNYQIPACGGFLLTERTNEICELFEEGKEIACYGSAEELVLKCKYYLANENERREIAHNGYVKVTTNGNTLLDRAKQIIKTVSE